MEFKQFNLHPDLQKGIDEAEYINCMPVQEQVLTHAFGGQDLYVQSQTGTGKTAAFLVVIFQRMLTEEALFKKKALIMAPTRELAVQIEEEAKMLGKNLPFKTGSFYGGVGYAQQEKLLRENAQILVGTPGRVLDLNKSGKMNLMDIAFLVLDEADRMFDMGFYPDLRKLIKVVPPADRRQTMLFSATLNSWVKNLAWEYTKSPFEIEITPEIVTVEEITQVLYHVSSDDKMRLLLGLFKKEKPDSLLVFCNTKKQTEIVAKRLQINGIDCEFIIGDLPQVKRLKIIDDVKAGKTKVLIATDVAARGLDIESLAMVINYDLPNEAENYVHRIGRTARAGKTGIAITFASEQDVYELPAVERYIGKKLPSEVAMPELYEDDKSKGQYIHIDSDEYRPHSGAARTGGKHSDKHGGKKNQAHTYTAEHHKSKERGGKQKREKTARVPDKTREQTAVHIIPPTADLSQLSMEERLSVYRKKYSGGSSAKHEANREHIKNKKQHHHAPEAKQHEKQTHPVPQESRPAPAGRGIISKLIGLFKKK
jgi:ATP-dependent RNA helicase RhlB